jgi:hypothetical protein
MSKRQENAIDTPSLVPAQRSQAQAIKVHGQGNAASDGLNPSPAQAAPIDRKARGNTTSNVPNP